MVASPTEIVNPRLFQAQVPYAQLAMCVGKVYWQCALCSLRKSCRDTNHWLKLHKRQTVKFWIKNRIGLYCAKSKVFRAYTRIWGLSITKMLLNFMLNFLLLSVNCIIAKEAELHYNIQMRPRPFRQFWDAELRQMILIPSCTWYNVGLSPSGKAQDFDSCIRWSESSQPREKPVNKPFNNVRTTVDTKK